MRVLQVFEENYSGSFVFILLLSLPFSISHGFLDPHFMAYNFKCRENKITQRGFIKLSVSTFISKFGHKQFEKWKRFLVKLAYMAILNEYLLHMLCNILKKGTKVLKVLLTWPT